jgi:hypothetical protein
MPRPRRNPKSNRDFPFCSNPDCVLYVRAGDPGVMGYGNGGGRSCPIAASSGEDL